MNDVFNKKGITFISKTQGEEDPNKNFKQWL